MRILDDFEKTRVPADISDQITECLEQKKKALVEVETMSGELENSRRAIYALTDRLTALCNDAKALELSISVAKARAIKYETDGSALLESCFR